jgi:hypothetical protein
MLASAGRQPGVSDSIAVCAKCGTPMETLHTMVASFDIRVHPTAFARLEKVFADSVLDKDVVSLNSDPSVDRKIGGVVMIHMNGRSTQWTSGLRHVESFVKLGYVNIQKVCPHRYIFGAIPRKCIGEKCQFSILRNSTRDCAHIWMVMK